MLGLQAIIGLPIQSLLAIIQHKHNGSNIDSIKITL